MLTALSQAKDAAIKVVGPFETEKAFFVSAKIEEGLSRITRTHIIVAISDDVSSTDSNRQKQEYKLDELLGEAIHVELKTKTETRYFRGTCIEAEYLGTALGASGRGHNVFSIVTQCWPFFLTLSKDNRIFQEKTVPDIVKDVCSEAGFADIKLRLTETYKTRDYTVQYQESDWDFVCRLLEEEGIFYYFDHTTSPETLVLGDGIGACDTIKDPSSIKYAEGINPGAGVGDVDKILGWNDAKRAVPTKASLVDYNFTTPGTFLGHTYSTSGKTYTTKREVYSMDGRYATTAEAEHYATVRGEAQAHDYERWIGSGNLRTIAPGGIFTLNDHPRVTDEKDFMVLWAEHNILAAEDEQEVIEMKGMDIVTAETEDDVSRIYSNRFEVIAKTTPYRPPLTTPWPDLSGVHTAVVTGPSGEEIYTDEYGRIKVQFHWDRDGKKDEKTTCWVRVMQAWAGKGYGSVMIPRIGWEVVVQFERNNPDRPMCIGTVYNAVNMPPYALPENMTQTTLRTESSKGGGGFNELVFEDKKGEEFVRMQSEKDYKQIIKNNAQILIGLEKKDPGTLSEHVHGNVTETYDNNHFYTLAHNLEEVLKEGYMKTELQKGDKAVWLTEGKLDTWLQKGDVLMTTNEGNYHKFVDKGNDKTVVGDGDYAVFVDSGQAYVKASDQIKFECGAASITMKKDGTIEIKGKDITIKGSGNVKAQASMNIEAKASMNFEAKGSMNAKVNGGIQAELKGGAMASVKGGIVKIN